MVAQVKMSAAGIGGGSLQAPSGTYNIPSDGIVTVLASDVSALLQAGLSFVNITTRWQDITPAPRAATAARIVGSTALANGTIAIANQPDCARLAGLRVDPGTSAITAGTAALIYTANDGNPQTDSLTLVAAASTPTTQNTSKGVLHLTSITIAGLVGGTSPLVQVNDTNVLSLMVQQGATDFAIIKANVDGADEAIGTVTSSAFSIAPTTAPNGTHTYGYGFSFNAPTY